MRFSIVRTSGEPCDDIPGAVKVERFEERRYLYDPHWTPTRALFEAHNPHSPVVREYEENGQRGLIYREDTSYWMIEVPDLDALLALGKTVGLPLILHTGETNAETDIEIYDTDREW